MELYALLVHRRYPEQPTVTVNRFFTKQGCGESVHFNAAQLQESSGTVATKNSETSKWDL